MSNSATEEQPFDRFRKDVSIFISHSNEDTKVASDLESMLKAEGFENAWIYENRVRFGKDKVNLTVRSAIEKCDFFVLMVSNASRKSEWVQRELGLALSIAKYNNGISPIIIPIIIEKKRTGLIISGLKILLARSKCFPCRDYQTGRRLPEVFSFDEERYFDPSCPADKNSVLINQMTPKLLLAGKDITKSTDLWETGVFDLYISMFPKNERVPPDDLTKLVLGSYNDKEPEVVTLNNEDGSSITYRFSRETIMLVLTLSDRAIGFVVFNYNHEVRLFFGTYFGVHRCWRSYDIAVDIMKEVKERISQEKRFNNYEGFVFDVEKINFEKVVSIIEDLENGKKKDLDFTKQTDYTDNEFGDDEKTNSDQESIRKLLRIVLYGTEGWNAFLFTDEQDNPLEYIQPCMDLKVKPEEWGIAESRLWLMFIFPKQRDALDISMLWEKVVKFIIYEHIGKTYARKNLSVGAKYLKYTESRLAAVLNETSGKRINLLDPSVRFSDINRLARRWIRLGKQTNL